MATLTHRTEVQLSNEELLGLEDIRGTRLTVVDGSVWLTLDHDLRDIFLNPGESFVVDRNGLTLLHALAPARLSVETYGDAAVLAPSAGLRLAIAALRRRLVAAVSPSPVAV